jgi:hypothetical protein
MRNDEKIATHALVFGCRHSVLISLIVIRVNSRDSRAKAAYSSRSLGGGVAGFKSVSSSSF